MKYSKDIKAIIWSSHHKNIPAVCAYKDKDDDLYVDWEGGTGIRLRDLLTFYNRNPPHISNFGSEIKTINSDKLIDPRDYRAFIADSCSVSTGHELKNVKEGSKIYSKCIHCGYIGKIRDIKK